jgi:hypothetical protein
MIFTGLLSTKEIFTWTTTKEKAIQIDQSYQMDHNGMILYSPYDIQQSNELTIHFEEISNLYQYNDETYSRTKKKILFSLSSSFFP